MGGQLAVAALALRALGLGDLLTAVPALRGIRRAVHGTVLLAGPPALAPLALLSGAVDGVVATGPLAVPPVRGPVPLAVNLHGAGPQSTVALASLRPARLVAYAHPDLAHLGPGPTWQDDEPERSRWTRLVGCAGMPADPDDLGLPLPDVPAPRGVVVVHPGAAYASRRWPADRWGQVAAVLAAAGEHVVVTGSAAERPLAQQVAELAGLPPDAVLAGRTGLLELAALVAHARLVLCGDTGTAHLATAYGTPSVVLFGPASPLRWAPPADRRQHVVLWSGRTGPVFADTPDPGLLEITPAQVLASLPPRGPRRTVAG